MYGQGGGGGQAGGVVGGAATTTAGVAALPSTGDNTMLLVVSLVAITLGVAALAVQLAVIGYRRRALKQL